MYDQLSAQELNEFDAEFNELAMEFEELAVDDDPEADAEIDEIDALAAETGVVSGALGEQSLSALAADEFEQQFIFNWVKRRAKKAVESAYRMFKKYARRCRPCARLIADTLRLYKSGKWVRATIVAIRAIRCIRKCVRG